MRARELYGFQLLALVLAVVWTWPLATELTSSLPHDPRFSPFAGSDVNIWVWNSWWARQVVETGAYPFYCDRIFPPFGHSLAFHTHTFLWGLLSVPLQWIGGVFFAYNAMLLLLLSLSATATYALARELGLRSAAAALAGLAWAFSPYFLQKGLVHLNLFASPWLPLGFLFALRWMGAREGERLWPQSLGLGLVAGLCLLTGSLQTVYLAFALGVLVLVRPRRSAEEEPSAWRLARPLPLVVAVVAAGLTAQPFLAEWLREWKATGGLPFPQEFHPRLADFFTPSGLHPLFRGYGAAAPIADAEFSGHRPEHAGLYLRYGLLALAAVGVLREPRARRWGLGFAVLFLLAWDPGPEPEGFLSRVYRTIPPLDLLRVPARLLPSALLFLSIAAGFGLHALLGSRRTRLAAGALVLGLAFESWIGPYPLKAVVVPEAVRRIAESPLEGSVLTLPYHPGATESMLWQTQHGKPVPVSYVARTRPSRMEAIRDATPDLFALSLGLAQPNPAALAVDLRNAGIAHILFRDVGGHDPEWLYSVLDEMDGWVRAPDFGDGVEWWTLAAP